MRVNGCDCMWARLSVKEGVSVDLNTYKGIDIPVYAYSYTYDIHCVLCIILFYNYIK